MECGFVPLGFGIDNMYVGSGKSERFNAIFFHINLNPTHSRLTSN